MNRGDVANRVRSIVAASHVVGTARCHCAGRIVRMLVVTAIVSGLLGCAITSGEVGSTNTPDASDSESSSTAPPTTQAKAATTELIGQPAPAFNLSDDRGGEITLLDLRGRWVLLHFYLMADTPACTCDATAFTAQLQRYPAAQSGPIVLTVGPDQPEDLAYFRRKYKLRPPMLSDPDFTVHRRYNAYLEPVAGRTFGRAIRAAVLIDPDGIVRQHWPTIDGDAQLRAINDTLRELGVELLPPPPRSTES